MAFTLDLIYNNGLILQIKNQIISYFPNVKNSCLTTFTTFVKQLSDLKKQN